MGILRMTAVYRAGDQGEVDLHPEESAVVFLTLMDLGDKIRCKMPFRPG